MVASGLFSFLHFAVAGVIAATLFFERLTLRRAPSGRLGQRQFAAGVLLRPRGGAQECRASARVKAAIERGHPRRGACVRD